MEAIIAAHGTRNVSVPLQPALVMQRGSAVQVGQEACGNRQAFHIMFIHADTGGRAQAGDIDDRSSAYCAAMQQICAWPPTRCVTIQPRHETEAWLLADPQAVMDSLGYRGAAKTLGLPSDASEAERLTDPKQVLAEAVRQVRGRRGRTDPKPLFAAIAQRQSLQTLRLSRSYAAFEGQLRTALSDLGCVSP